MTEVGSWMIFTLLVAVMLGTAGWLIASVVKERRQAKVAARMALRFRETPPLQLD